MPDSEEDAAIVRAILALAHSLELIVTAEGTETIEQIDFLTDHDCELLQGYYFSRPLPFDAFREFASTYSP